MYDRGHLTMCDVGNPVCHCIPVWGTTCLVRHILPRNPNTCWLSLSETWRVVFVNESIGNHCEMLSVTFKCIKTNAKCDKAKEIQTWQAFLSGHVTEDSDLSFPNSESLLSWSTAQHPQNTAYCRILPDSTSNGSNMASNIYAESMSPILIIGFLAHQTPRRGKAVRHFEFHFSRLCQALLAPVQCNADTWNRGMGTNSAFESEAVSTKWRPQTGGWV